MNARLALWLAAVALAGAGLASEARAQARPYIGYVYPAGGQQAATFEVKLGGQALDNVERVLVSGDGVAVRLLEYQRKIGPQEMQLLREQQRLLKQGPKDEAARAVAERVERRIREYVQTPACAAIASIVRAEVTIAAGATPGPRELRVVTARGVSNPLVFHVGQLPEHVRPAMTTASLHVLGKEALALRNRPTAETELRVTTPCLLNGQIAAREANRYRFAARKGERLVIAVQARQLIPYVADAVPGWFQPVLTLFDAAGRELAYADDFRFKPDPVILYPVQQDGEYVIEIRDSLYRGREDFIYRIAVGEIPFVTSVFPLGANVKQPVAPALAGWNLDGAQLRGLAKLPRRGTVALSAQRAGVAANSVPFALSDLPETMEQEGNDTLETAAAVTLPVIVNGRIGRAGDRDVYSFTGKAGELVGVEVIARRLESPLDAVVTVTDAQGVVLEANDDREDILAGANTHHADAQVTAVLPADGRYFVHVADTANQGGDEYGYRLRLSAPRPDFELRVVPSSVSLAARGNASVTVYVRRLDGFTGPVKIGLEKSASGIVEQPVTLAANQTSVRLNLRGGGDVTPEPVALKVVGVAKVGAKEIARVAGAAEDRMQAFLWRHLVPAEELLAMTYDSRVQPVPKRVAPVFKPSEVVAAITATEVKAVAGGKPDAGAKADDGLKPEAGAAAGQSPAVASAPTATAGSAPAGSGSSGGAPVAAAGAAGTVEPPKPKFTKQQIAGRLRQLKLLYEEGLLTDAFYLDKVAECETSA